MKKMHTSQKNTASEIISITWDTIAQASWGVIGVMAGLMMWLLRIIGGIQFNNWKNGREKINQEIIDLKQRIKGIEDVVFFFDVTDGKDTNIRRFMVHEFKDQRNILDQIDRHVDSLEEKIKTNNAELLKEIKQLLKDKE